MYVFVCAFSKEENQKHVESQAEENLVFLGRRHWEIGAKKTGYNEQRGQRKLLGFERLFG